MILCLYTEERYIYYGDMMLLSTAQDPCLAVEGEKKKLFYLNPKRTAEPG